jgi:hypothetical protein
MIICSRTKKSEAKIDLTHKEPGPAGTRKATDKELSRSFELFSSNHYAKDG